MKSATAFSSFFFALGALSAPSGSALLKRQQNPCELYSYWSGNGYEVLNNLWGRDTATSGSQCTYVDGSSNNGVSWHSTWTWVGAENNVKSYAYVGKIATKGRKISTISSMQTSATWSYNNMNLRANVAYDVFTAADPNHDRSSGDYELMVWLARIGGVYPIGSSVGTVSVGGRTWDLWVGYNGSMRVYSFIAPSTITNYSGNLMDFFNYLKNNQGYPASSQNLIIYQFGSEAFTGGPTTFTVSNWSANYN